MCKSPLLKNLATLFCAGLLLGCAARAQQPDADSDAADPPARVGRVSALRGPVDTSHEAGAAWEPAKLNQPVTTATALWAQPGSQTEVRIGSSSVRLDDDTQAVFSQLDDHGVAIDVAQGTVRARVRNLPSGDRFTLAADGVRAEAQGPGDYRVSYDPDRRTYTVRSLAGRLRVVTPNNSYNLEAGQESLVERGGENLQLRPLGQRDDFDLWAEARDRDQDQLASARYVSPETTGIEALDEHGRWDTVPEYGAVWYPRALPYGWAPYRYGHWAYVRPWGWTWVDDAPWGFAPFHYGRWALIGGGWGWVPGPIVTRPVWAPALVGYVGGRSGNVSVSIGIGAPIGWFPLGPREVYYPPYRYSPRYRQHVNIINVTNVTVVQPPPGDRRAGRPQLPDSPAYRYAQRPEALTVASEEQFRHARSIGRNRIDLTPQQAAQLRPVTMNGPDRRAGGTPGAAPNTSPGAPPVAVLPTPPRRDARLDDQRRGGPEPRGDRRRPERPDAENSPRAVLQPAVPGPGAAAPAPIGAPGSAREPGPAPAMQPVAPVQRAPVEVLRPEDPRADRGDRSMRRHQDERDGARGGERWRDHGQPRSTPEPARTPQPAPQLALPQVTPSPQVIPRPAPLPQAMPAPQVLPRPVPVPPPPPRAIPPPQQQAAPLPRAREPERAERGDRGDRGDRRGPDGDGPQGGGRGQRER